MLNDVTSSNKLQTTIDKYGPDSPPDPAVLFLLSNEAAYDANLHIFQKTFERDFELDVFYDAAGPASRLDGASPLVVYVVCTSSVSTASALSAGLAASRDGFDRRFERVFELTDKGYSEADIDVARQLVASMLGGIGYFHGSSIVDRSFAHAWDDESDFTEDGPVERTSDPRLSEPRQLFTATPSRPFFPRGFYWDEGFHLLVIGAFDNDLSLSILQDWLGLIDEEGWIAREQILGEEARSKVPQQFWTQFPHHANPPTLVMAITAFIRQLDTASREGEFGIGDADPHQRVLAAGAASTSNEERLASRHLTSPALGRAYLRSIYPSLKRHYAWFRRTQRGQSDGRSMGYRWRGRTETHVLTSGLDDYPRAPKPSSGELHLDLACWMAAFGRTMAEIAEAVGEEEDREEYEGHAKALWATIEGAFALLDCGQNRGMTLRTEVHWNEDEKMYCDVSVDEDGASLPHGRSSRADGQRRRELLRLSQGALLQYSVTVTMNMS